MYYHKWKAEIMEQQRKFYNKVAIILGILGLSMATVVFWEIIRRIP